MDYVFLLFASPLLMACGITIEMMPNFPTSIANAVLWVADGLYLLILPAAIKKIYSRRSVVFSARASGLNVWQTFRLIFDYKMLFIHFLLSMLLIIVEIAKQIIGIECIVLCSSLVWHGIGLIMIAKWNKNLPCRFCKNDEHWSKMSLLYPILIRTATLVIAFSLINNTCVYFQQLLDTLPIGSAWSDMDEDYGVVPGLFVGNDEDEIYFQINQTDIAINGILYPWLNQRGAIYCYISTDAKGMSVITVNPNFLKLYPVFDKDGKAVTVDEKETATIILNPLGNTRLTEITDYFQKQRDERLELEKIWNVAPLTNDSSIRVIQIRSGQRVFTLSPSEPYVTNAVIRVITENNSLVTDRYCIGGGGILDPLKICIKQDYRAELQQILQELDLIDNIHSIVSIKEYRNMLIEQCKEVGGSLLAVILLSAFISIILDWLVLYSYMRKRFCEVNLKYCLGWPFYKRYAWFGALQIIYLAMTVIFALLARSTIAFTAITLLIEVIEMIAVAVMALQKECRKRSLYLKGE